MRKVMMISILAIVLSLFIFTGVPTPALAAQAFSIYGFVFTESYPLLSSVTATGTGTPQTFNLSGFYVPLSYHSCTALWSGTTPSNIRFAVEGSENGSSYSSIVTSGTDTMITMTTSPHLFWIDIPLIRYIRGNYVDKSNGDGTTALSLDCTSGNR